eukprot:SM000089S23816  [mRNA]  locus=s89:131722:136118:- [translate_table: standard]
MSRQLGSPTVPIVAGIRLARRLELALLPTGRRTEGHGRGQARAVSLASSQQDLRLGLAAAGTRTAQVLRRQERDGGGRCSFAAVFDGHGGRRAAEYARTHLHASVLAAGLLQGDRRVFATVVDHDRHCHHRITCSTLYLTPYSCIVGCWGGTEGQQGGQEGHSRRFQSYRRGAAGGELCRFFDGMLQYYVQSDSQETYSTCISNWQDGATVVCAWIIEKKAYVANVGDAKAVLARCSSNPAAVADGGAREAPQTGTQSAAPAAAVLSGGKLRGLVVTREHKAIFPQERARIEKSGGHIESGRLQGRLEVSRAFGDRQFKKLGVTAIPDIHVFELTPQEHFLILGCDGLWGVLSPEDAVDLVQAQLTEGASIAVACKRLVREAVRERRCKDNCTAVLIVFA